MPECWLGQVGFNFLEKKKKIDGTNIPIDDTNIPALKRLAHLFMFAKIPSNVRLGVWLPGMRVRAFVDGIRFRRVHCPSI